MNFDKPLHWREDIHKSGYNVLTLGIWVEALYRWLGPATSVLAKSRVTVQQRKNEETNLLDNVQVPDHVDVIAELACGAQANMQVIALSDFLKQIV